MASIRSAAYAAVKAFKSETLSGFRPGCAQMVDVNEPTMRILENCRRAMSATSKVLIIEMIIPPGDGPFFGKILDLEMLVNVGGRERTLEEYGELLRRSGFRVNRVIPTSAPSSIMEAIPS